MPEPRTDRRTADVDLANPEHDRCPGLFCRRHNRLGVFERNHVERDQAEATMSRMFEQLRKPDPRHASPPAFSWSAQSNMYTPRLYGPALRTMKKSTAIAAITRAMPTILVRFRSFTSPSLPCCSSDKPTPSPVREAPQPVAQAWQPRHRSLVFSPPDVRERPRGKDGKANDQGDDEDAHRVKSDDQAEDEYGKADHHQPCLDLCPAVHRPRSMRRRGVLTADRHAYLGTRPTLSQSTYTRSMRMPNGP